MSELLPREQALLRKVVGDTSSISTNRDKGAHRVSVVVLHSREILFLLYNWRNLNNFYGINSGDSFIAPSFSRRQNNVFTESHDALEHPHCSDWADFPVVISPALCLVAFRA